MMWSQYNQPEINMRCGALLLFCYLIILLSVWGVDNVRVLSDAHFLANKNEGKYLTSCTESDIKTEENLIFKYTVTGDSLTKTRMAH